MANEEILMIAELEQEMKQLEERLGMLEQQTLEMQKLEQSLDEIKKNKEKKIMAGLGRGIFMKAEIKEEDLFVDVGSGVILKKSVEDTKKIIKEQVKKMFEFKQKLIGRAEQIRTEMEMIIEKAQKAEEK